MEYRVVAGLNPMIPLLREQVILPGAHGSIDAVTCLGFDKHLSSD